jgi:hypothetical protein
MGSEFSFMLVRMQFKELSFDPIIAGNILKPALSYLKSLKPGSLGIDWDPKSVHCCFWTVHGSSMGITQAFKTSNQKQLLHKLWHYLVTVFAH